MMFFFTGKIILLFSVMCFTLFGNNSQIISPVDSVSIIKKYYKSDYANSIDSLKILYGKNKKLPKGFELQTLLALSHYPELKNIKIDFIYRRAIIPLSSRPRLFSLLRKKKNRKYKVIISSKSNKAMENVLVKNLPFNAQIGIIGHELAHSIYYQDKNFFNIIAIGALYVFPEFRSEFEKNTDKRTILYGLGWQLLEYADYVRNLPELSNKNNYWMDKYYLNPQEIKKVIQDNYR
ncbi:MAG: hypothetical protein GXO79_01725 [Chlorobi bacterium]|nr:hypothetical protein [Chlorobiota bacterium]